MLRQCDRRSEVRGFQNSFEHLIEDVAHACLHLRQARLAQSCAIGQLKLSQPSVQSRAANQLARILRVKSYQASNIARRYYQHYPENQLA